METFLPPPPAAQGVAEPPVEAIATLSRRFGAFCVDFVGVLFLALVVFIGAAAAVGVWAGFTGKPDGWIDDSPLFIHYTLMSSLVAWPLAGWAYLVGCELAFGGSPGKLLLKLRVRRNDGRRVGFWQANVREVARLLSLVLAGLPALFALADERRRTPHDRLAGTVVVVLRGGAHRPLIPPPAETAFQLQ